MALHLLPPELQEMVVSLLPLSSRAGDSHVAKIDQFLCSPPSSSLGGLPPLAALPLDLPPLLPRLDNHAAQRLARFGAGRARLPAAVVGAARPQRDVARVSHLLNGAAVQGQECVAGADDSTIPKVDTPRISP